MDYYGENSYFRFSAGCLESTCPERPSVSAAADAAACLASHFRRFSVGCDGFSHVHHLYALCSGISAAGRDVYVYENTDLPSFRFGFPLLSSDCGLFISENSTLRISVFGADRLPVSAELLAELMQNRNNDACAEKCGRITPAASFRSLYTANIREKLALPDEGLDAAVSCGTRSVRTLWEYIFTNENSNLVFQVSTDGQTVNAFSQKHGFIPAEKLLLAYAAMFPDAEGTPVPVYIHFAADVPGISISRLSPDELSALPQERIRHITDPLYLCAALASDRGRFSEILSQLPEMSSVRRDITVTFRDMKPFRRTVPCSGGVVRLTRSGRNRLSLIAQARSAETASELCTEWTSKLINTDIEELR
ncbi:MAG: hypothetical protein IKO47_10555 [Ruminococcus sp.]|nr:hypothetical protein [Ruminococcus sp.]